MSGHRTHINWLISFLLTSVLYHITNEQVRRRVSNMMQKKNQVIKNDMKLLTFYNLFVTQFRLDATIYKQEKDSLTRYHQCLKDQISLKKIKNI